MNYYQEEQRVEVEINLLQELLVKLQEQLNKIDADVGNWKKYEKETRATAYAIFESGIKIKNDVIDLFWALMESRNEKRKTDERR